MSYYADHGGDVVGHMFNGDLGGPRPSMYRPRRSENDQFYPSRASSLLGIDGGINRSNNNPVPPGTSYQPPPTPYLSGPLPYASSNTSSTFSSGPGVRSQPPPAQQQQQQASAAPGGDGLSAQAPHTGTGSHPGAAQPPPQQQQQQPYQAPPPNNTGIMNDAASSIYSMPAPANNSGTHTTPGAYYAPTTNSSSSDLNGGYGYPYPGQAQQPYQQHMYQQQPHMYQQQQQYQPHGINPSSVFTATSYSPTQGPPFNNMNGPRPSSAYGPNIGGPPAHGGPMNIPVSPIQEKSNPIRMESAGKFFLGALATGAVAYGIREYRENRENSAEQEKKDKERRQQEEAEARRRREEEERQRLKAYNEMHGTNADSNGQGAYPQQNQQPYMQQSQAYAPQQSQAYAPQPANQQQQQSQPTQQQQQQSYPQAAPALSAAQAQAQAHEQAQAQVQYYAHQQQTNTNNTASNPASERNRSVSISSSGKQSNEAEGFKPPAPFGRPDYTYNQNDVRQPNPSRSTEGSQTAETYPELRQNPGDTKMKIGTIMALKHNVSGRHLRTDRSHSTSSGSNQQLAYAHRWTTDEDDWWQVLPANTETPAPGSIVSYGTQVRLRHYETGRHLHSHYGYVDAASGQNEVTAYGDQRHSDENDHWVVERWGDGGYGKTWKSTDPIVLRHYVSGMVLHSHDTQDAGEFQPVVCTGMGKNENDKWRVVLGS
ncbi:hypothetical protein H4S08_002818 [Coemansia sp. RSA 1365]|nr:hypothetical protein H4S08_002818 [Coemansia sp. RSA 1365]